MKISAVVPILWVAMVPPVSGQSAADHIRSLRAESNAAIARHDVEGVVSQFDLEYQITTGNGSLYHDPAAESGAWAEEFARADDLLYVRTPESVEVSSTGDRAAEIGVWSGSWTTAGGVRNSGGRYAAHWVLASGSWTLRSELFVTLTCEGTGCSRASAASGPEAEDQIRALRAQSNAAIARHEVEGVVSLLDVDYQVTVGSGALRHDRAAEPERWTATFAQADDLVFVRTPESVEVSASYTRAAEIGVWSGSSSTAEGMRSLGGRYAAHWVLADGRWKLRSELFVRLRCEGVGCT